MKIYVTKYALTQGIFEADAEIDQNRWAVVKAVGSMLSSYYPPGEWHPSMDLAVKKAESMRRKKIASLKKQIAKLKALKFKVTK